MPSSTLPPSHIYKNIAVTLLFCIFFGPLGLLYASFWGGVTMIALGFIVFQGKFMLPIIIFWLCCSIWGVAAAEHYNRKLLANLNR